MQISEKRIEKGFMKKGDFDKAWFGLVEEIVDLEDHLNREKASGDEDALSGIYKLQQQLGLKRKLLKKLDVEGLY